MTDINGEIESGEYLNVPVPEYHPGILDGVPDDFKRRTKFSATRPLCVIFLYSDGTEPDFSNIRYGNAHEKPNPTYKGERPKKIAWEGAHGSTPGAVIKETCGTIGCIRQDHLYVSRIRRPRG